MGIKKLLQELTKHDIPKRVHLSEYKGQTVAIDGYAWLYVASYGSALQLALGQHTTGYITSFVNQVERLRQHGVIPLIVFDGGALPTKAAEEAKRRRDREANLAEARQLYDEGLYDKAKNEFKKTLHVTPAMAYKVMQEMRRIGVHYIVAPYEADAQMAYLAMNGVAHAVITEDSDLLAYGCPRVLFKLSKIEEGFGQEVLIHDVRSSETVGAKGLSQDKILEWCILSGCDFLDSLPGIGIKTALAKLRMQGSFVKVAASVRASGKDVPPDYEQQFQLAKWVFRHQRVYDPRTKTCVHLTPLPPGGLQAAGIDVTSALPKVGEIGPDGNVIQDVTDFLGPYLPPDIAQGIAEGRLHPMTKEPYEGASTVNRTGMSAQQRRSNLARRAALRNTVAAAPASTEPVTGSSFTSSNQPSTVAMSYNAQHAQHGVRGWSAMGGFGATAVMSSLSRRSRVSGHCGVGGSRLCHITPPAAASTLAHVVARPVQHVQVRGHGLSRAML